ncbi:MAG: nitrate reductase subunit beta, partial [Planctomycetes bacterium]|nr:nitrate reductase subunit beta [Planctomycetota bacterium]
RIEETARLADDDLVEGQRSLILDPFDPQVIAAAHRRGIHPSVVEAAQKSPVYKFVKTWKIALAPHLEWRTLPMLFYVPPLLPVMSHRDGGATATDSDALFHEIEEARAPLAYLASLLGAGNVGKVAYALRKQMAVRQHRRAVTVGDVDREVAARMLREADTTPEEADEIYRLTALCTFEDRFVIPPAHREEAIEMMNDPLEHKQSVGFGFLSGPRRGL